MTESTLYLVLTKDEHALLGELVEIMGLIESVLIASAERVDPVASKKIRNATAGGQGQLWANAITGGVTDPQIAASVARAERELKQLAEDRNDFIHALFENDYVERGYMEPGIQTTSATRSKTGATRPTSDLEHFPTGMNRVGIPKTARVRFKLHAGEGGQHVWPGRFRLIFVKG
ncbi:hypothetical protein [Bradyrhizobium sp. 2S1]|uniref:hypothetical protein n=1 Tax=Bradyrhizobium sp. 2S1 TaxID=1404429 RepID=UPI0014091536|nr:hypothetical protein [Bradyrhizobium sp. 2S1]MCK7667842.1 hypothetical protein [Bradyrhizobium sp. 2S1]